MISVHGDWKWVVMRDVDEYKPVIYCKTTILNFVYPSNIDLLHWRHKGSHLHNNDVQTSVAQRARVVLAVRIGTQPLSAQARAGQPGGVACRGCPLAACLTMTHVAVFRLTPNAGGSPSVTSYAYGLFSWFWVHKTWSHNDRLQWE